MFVKLIVLIMALGSTGVGVLSVRQSRLVASNEMTQSRLRSRELSQRAMELRAQIAQRITPDQLNRMISESPETIMVDQTLRKIDLIDHSEPVVYRRPAPDLIPPALTTQTQTQAETDLGTQPSHEPDYWTLDDGTRVYLINPATHNP